MMSQNCSLSALEKAIASEEHNPKISPYKIQKNLIAICEVEKQEGKKVHVKRQSTGVLLTDDGWVITAYHCIEDFLPEWNKLALEFIQVQEDPSDWIEETKGRHCVYTSEIRRFPIDFSNYVINEASKKYDLALIKIITNKKPKPTGVILSPVEPTPNEPVNFYGITGPGITIYNAQGIVRFYCHQDFKVTHRGSRKLEDNVTVDDAFLTDVFAPPMTSGGALLNSRGQFIGIASFMAENMQINNVEEGNVGYSGPVSGFARAGHAIELVKDYIARLTQG